MKKVWKLLFTFGLIPALSAIAAEKPAETIRIASWNIGHFSLGQKKDSTILPQNGSKMATAHREFLKSVNADLLGIAEYSSDFTTDGGMKAEQAVFSNYRIHRIGPANNYQWNAQFLKQGKVLTTHTVNYRKRVQKTYYLLTKLQIDGKTAVWAATHLDWKDDEAEYRYIRPGEIRQLINELKKYPIVIITGDFNVRSAAEFKIFEENGYQLANNGKYPTWPANKPVPGKNTLDDIIVKGLEIRNVKVMARPDLSDHALIYADVALKK